MNVEKGKKNSRYDHMLFCHCSVFNFTGTYICFLSNSVLMTCEHRLYGTHKSEDEKAQYLVAMITGKALDSFLTRLTMMV
jgi:hypothetical protein